MLFNLSKHPVQVKTMILGFVLLVIVALVYI